MLRQSDAANVKNQTDIVNNKASEQEVETSQFAALAHKLKTQEEAKSESSPSIFAKLKSKFSKKKTPAAVRTIEEKPDDAPPPYESMDDIRSTQYTSIPEKHTATDTSCCTNLSTYLSNCCFGLFSQDKSGYQPIRTNSTRALLTVPYEDTSSKNRFH